MLKLKMEDSKKMRFAEVDDDDFQVDQRSTCVSRRCRLMILLPAYLLLSLE